MSAAYYRLKKHRQKPSVEIEDELQVLTSRRDVPKFEQNQLDHSNLPIDETLSIHSLCPSQPTDTKNHDNDLLDCFEYIDTPQDFS
ncbi:unnamed protein product [Macrosiphum euphorbiae]|uniref:Uncharacterized protein n=1 Tax=Macrosiphum euphorbiae TaxID=13131 RepID=A0AAV0WL42_9HEMI|nr:unnamed protein product [Macrosiphum euphorbiae]